MPGHEASAPGSASIRVLPRRVRRARAEQIGFITTGRNTANNNHAHEMSWVCFRQKAQQAEELCLPKQTAQGLIGTMGELEDNVHEHCGKPESGIVAFRGSTDKFEFVVADGGMGMLASLRTSPDYEAIEDAGQRLR